jgi:hypothetical protein
MDPKLIRDYVRRKKRTVWGTFVLLLLLAAEFYYLNCHSLYISGFCELTLLFIILAVMVAGIGICYGGEPMKTGTRQASPGKKK